MSKPEPSIQKKVRLHPLPTKSLVGSNFSGVSASDGNGNAPIRHRSCSYNFALRYLFQAVSWRPIPRWCLYVSFGRQSAGNL